MTTNDGPPAQGPGADAARTPVRIRQPRLLPEGRGLDRAMTKLAAAVIFIALIHEARMEPHAAGLLTVEIVTSICLINSADPVVRSGGTKVKQLLNAITG
ncbi:hypothetical protein [Streptomyces roseoverticillatus]|uniref:hypothetical protein n=1 Tax=Streptomyces roseoverticillatus TaxID=66429 RepID=UPI0004C21503|nr:hypothetical protein [Streptomyces roseoverticillatus]